MKRYIAQFTSIIGVLFFVSSCQYVTHTDDSQKIKTAVTTSIEHADWTESAVIYEVNIRQYTPEGTFKAFIEHMPRLKDMGVDILWLMPINPIGEKNRKGSLGSYYSVKDYKSINREYGTMDDFEDLVKEAHALDMYLIIDWVANHTSWDNALVKDHPGWYKKDSIGNIISPFDWTDVAQLDYTNKELRTYMTNAMKFWVEEMDIDGFRCDVAGLVPCDFWDSTRVVLNEVKPIFMLAEAEKEICLVEKAFDMNYAWDLHHIMNYIAKRTMDARDLKKYFKQQDSIYDPAVFRMNFTSNHDENSWNGSEFERLGDAAEAFALLTFTVPGMPLIYSGQEIGLNKRLRFFDKDTIEWKENNKWTEVYKKFIELKKEHSVFWNGASGGTLKTIAVKGSKIVFAFERINNDEHAIVLLNFSDKEVEFKLKDQKLTEGRYSDYFNGQDAKIDGTLLLPPYGYKVLFDEL
jgi:glycosidase